MLIREVADPNAGKLMALTTFLAGRSADTTAKKEISTGAFIQMAKNLGVNVTPETLGNLIAQPPLSNILEPFEPASGVVRFKGNTDTEAPMSPDKARDVVDANAKKALNRRT